MLEDKVKGVLREFEEDNQHFRGIFSTMFDPLAKAICDFFTEECPECKGKGTMLYGERPIQTVEHYCYTCKGEGRIPKGIERVKAERRAHNSHRKVFGSAESKGVDVRQD